MATKTCEHCGSIYLRHRSFGKEQWASSRFCSRQCRGKAITGISTGPKPEIRIGNDVPCVQCGKMFYAAPWMKRRRTGAKFCSQPCAYIGRELKATFVKGHADVVPAEARKRAGAKASKSLTGRKLSPEHRAKTGLANLGRKLSVEHIRKSLRRRPMSSLEESFIKIVADAGLPFRFVGNGEVFVGRKNPDFVATNGEKLAVEVFYRRHKEQFRGGAELWKSERAAEFNRHGWRVMFFDETEVKHERVKAALGGV